MGNGLHYSMGNALQIIVILDGVFSPLLIRFVDFIDSIDDLN
jgi:hypothetical protein